MDTNTNFKRSGVLLLALQHKVPDLDRGSHHISSMVSIGNRQAACRQVSITNRFNLLHVVPVKYVIKGAETFVYLLYKVVRGKVLRVLCKAFKIGKQNGYLVKLACIGVAFFF